MSQRDFNRNVMPSSQPCKICGASDATGDDIGHCADCAHLLRWFRSYFADVRNYDLTAITGKTRFFEDLGLDSLDYVEWMMEAETIFGIHISDRDAQRMQTM